MLTVVTVTYHSSDVLPSFLAALPAALAGTAAQLVVADNASGDGTLALLRRRAPDALAVNTGANLGYAGGINAALAAATAAGVPAGPVLVVNPDVRLHPGSVPVLLAALAEPGTGIAVPRLLDEHGRLSYSLRREPTVRRVLGEALLGGLRAGRFPGLGEMVTDPAAYRSGRIADWATGACLLVSAECAQRLGRWDDSFFLYSEETDFALRARDAGFALRYVPEAVATHRGGAAHSSPFLWQLLVGNRWRLYRRRHGPLAAAGFRAALVLDALPRARVGRAPARAALRTLLSAGLARPPDRPGPRSSEDDGAKTTATEVS